MVTVADLLRLPALSGAEVVAGHDRLAGPVRWATVTEWPVEGFVRPDEVVLSTGIGLDELGLVGLVEALAEASAAGLGLSVDPSHQVDVAAPVAAARRLGLPMFTLPWDRRFADVALALVDLLLHRRYGLSAAAPDRLHLAFTTALLDGRGLNGIAEVVETMLDRPAGVLDDDLRVVVLGRRAAKALAAPPPPDLVDTTCASGDAARGKLRRSLASSSVTEFDGRGLPLPGPARVAAATAQGEVLGFVWVPGGEGAPLADRVMEHAAVAVALERLRLLQTRTDRAERLGQAAWRLAQGAANPTGMSELRVPPGGRVELAVGRPRGPIGDVARRRIADRLTRRGLAAGWSDDELLAVRTHTPAATPPMEALLDRDGDPSMIWGVAPPDEVEHLPGRLRSARALRQLAGGSEERGVVTGQAAGALGALATILSDDHAVAVAYETLRCVLEHDERTGRGLLHTLWSYVQHQRNTSSTARALFLNRHSLLYRLARIEEMTARSLSDSEDIFALEVAVRVVAAVDPARVSPRRPGIESAQRS